MTDAAPRLTRAALRRAGTDLPAPPVRIVHMGLGGFHRAHQAWFTARAVDGAQWGIAAFTGRSADVATRLAPQDGLYTVVVRGAEADRFEVTGSIAEVHEASSPRFAELVAASQTAVITLTITEAGYHLDAAGALDLGDPDVAHDVDALRSGGTTVRTPIARLTHGLRLRHDQGAGPVAVVSCDNLPRNDRLVEDAVDRFAAACGWDAAAWEVSFVATSVDRITPRTTPADTREVARETGWHDEGVVVTEPFADWTLSGDFPAGRPRWESAGARFVDDIEPYERRKLLVLNGGHLVLAFGGLLRGHATVSDAMGDSVCRGALERFWADAAAAVGADIDTADYRRALTERFGNARIAHHLSQIAVDTATKLRLRIVPVLSAALADDRDPTAALDVLRDWAACLDAGLIEPGRGPDELRADLITGLDAGVAATIVAAVDPTFHPTALAEERS
ncbi:mannitol dehydrogenase family protein [Microbacterium hibisci]|uniref:mannitol dehydrogenase family protein n=1 Tax=Microbacterium hibisci TaxID=2036000 RepID=UPI001944A260|nr:mannitol dehydrogenase family protein [Microbacterium hibisci]